MVLHRERRHAVRSWRKNVGSAHLPCNTVVNHSQNMACFVGSLKWSEFVREKFCAQVDVFDFKMLKAHTR